MTKRRTVAGKKAPGPAPGHTPARWRDVGSYPQKEDTPVQYWAGEFLLRNVDFQAALARLRGMRGPLNDPRSPYRKLCCEVGERFGLSLPYIVFDGEEPVFHPAFRAAPYSLRSRVRLHGVAGEWFLGRDDGWGAALLFDLRRPIAPQLRAAEKMLKGIHRGVAPLKGTQRDRGADYQAMLRILDARASSASWREIANVIFPMKNAENAADHAKKLHKRAVELRDHGYLYLPSLSAGKRGR